MHTLQRTRKSLIRLIHWRIWRGRMLVWLAAALAALMIVMFARMVDLAIDGFNHLRQLAPWSKLTCKNCKNGQAKFIENQVINKFGFVH